MEPVAAECPLRHHTLTIDALPQVCHQLIVAVSAHGRWDESDEVLSHVLDGVEDLWLGAGLNVLARAAVDTGCHFRLFVVLLFLLFFVALLMLQVQFVLPSPLSVHGASFERVLLLQEVHVVLELGARRHLNPVEICLCGSDSLFEANFPSIDINLVTGLIARLAAVPQARDDVLRVAVEDLSEDLVEVVLL